MITIFYTINGKIHEHVVDGTAGAGDWFDAMTQAHPDFCVVCLAMNRFGIAFGDECPRELRMH